MPHLSLLLGALLAAVTSARAQDAPARFEPIDVFDIEFASDPRISPDGTRVAYLRNFMDIMEDRRRANLWIVDVAGGDPRPLTTGNTNIGSPRWSPSGDRIAFVAAVDGKPQIHVRWMDSGQSAAMTRLLEPPAAIAWSPDGRWIAFSMNVAAESKTLAQLPPAPEGASWAPPAKVIDTLLYRSDGRGYLDESHRHVFVVPADGGSPRQVTSGPYDHGGRIAWVPDGSAILVSANRREDREAVPNDSEIWEFPLSGGEPRALTSRFGPDNAPAVSPDGTRVAYVGFDDRFQGYQLTRLYVANRASGEARCLTADLDRSVGAPVWASDGESLFFSYHDEGNTKIARVGLAGEMNVVTDSVGGTSLGRPYSSGSFSVSANGDVAYTHSRPDRPADLALVSPAGAPEVLTALNEDLFAHKELGAVEELWCESSHDGRPIQAWLVKPPGFDASQTHPLLLEIHGGPFANYGPRFAAELQLFAAAGYVVLYVNPRGSTSYGEEFGNLIHHAYPGHDYDDLMSAVDAVLARGFVDEERMFVTGGSGGGVLTSWIVGKNDRFRAAVVAKPVINWYSFVLTADSYNFFYRYWFPGFPWDHAEHYLARSPLSLVGNVSTPTMLLTGEADYRTPISESEQYYQALKLRGVDTAMVRIPEASHGIAARPSHLISKVAHILAWFEKYDEDGGEAESGAATSR